ncbi:MAG: hypothetical protein D6731_13910 [Planctomycetota bacterium]|nr:MAG: hypothetical protein D6731_13910 [Planctomycetota bacterium]
MAPAGRRVRRPAARAELLFVTLVVCVVGGEGALALLSPQARSVPHVYEERAEPSYGLRPGAEDVVDNQETRWRIRIDDQGHRVRLRGARQGAPRRTVLALGDSFAFGYGVDYEQSFLALFEDSLPADFALVNAGVPGYGPREYLSVLRSELARAPPPRRSASPPTLATTSPTSFAGEPFAFEGATWSRKRQGSRAG